MAIEEVVNVSDISNFLGPAVSAALSPVITIIKVVGVVVFIYIIYIIIKGLFEWRRHKKIDATYEKVLEIDRKLDELLKRTPKKEKLIKKEKKTGFFAWLSGNKDSNKEKKKK